ncbi:EpsG family protein [Epilithonimonas ginsengisoli]|uniref:EpsG family protein n=1 Tax=Epilithonimonas ginsengisoli TaxID=1245592 RepID=A0ABU4JJ27_9FLAO|nr:MULTISPECIES: EpsG family protein [Chryseobacterium group]MBV6879076.1 EpsG family protein [Epilithonimonas sp. FP105]MDW8549511.1 EpsG family protein [Epilithonimonas ginsengisoli]OAH74375.1 hypothetical protein AXA65_06335 [Chryseobacterium sp. FP211-J200]
MFDFVPLPIYSAVYYNVMFVIMLMVLLHSMVYDIREKKSLDFFHVLGYILIVVMILYMGFRPVSGRYFADMATYRKGYLLMQRGVVKIEHDYAFNYFMWACSQIMHHKYFFFIVDVLYIIPCYIFSKKYFSSYWFYAFFMFAGSFSFWAYGTNGIRNGLATSFFILALCYYEKKWMMYLWFLIGMLFHSSLVIPLAAYITSSLYKDPKVYLYIWLAAIPLSLAGGSVWQELFFNNLGFSDRTSGYMEGESVEGSFSSSGFRWDFLLYSSFGIIAGYYFIFVKNIHDKFYIHLFGIYSIANAFWILVITANYSNRFAYLSWFMMAPVIAYPMFKYKIWKDQYKMFGIILSIYYLFTYLMFLKNGK